MNHPEQPAQSPHLGVDQLGDYADHLLAPLDVRAVEAHLATCDACAARLRELEALLALAASAPASIEPPRDLWPLVRARIDTPAPRRAAQLWLAPGASLAAAAALLLVVGAATVTTRLRGGLRAGDPDVPPTAASVVTAPAGYELLDAEYARAAAQLTAAVNAERGALAPGTVATVERSVRTIDAAITEARAALGRDPHNPILVEMLSASYEQKLALLKRTANLPSQL